MLVVQVIVPTFFILGVGYATGKLVRYEVRTLSNLAIYVLTPSLVFHRLYVGKMNLGTLGKIGLYTLIIVGAMYLVSLAVSRAASLPQADASAFQLASALFNAGNMGLPIVLFAFGEEGLAYAIVLVVWHVLVTNTAGVFIAARAHRSVVHSLAQVFVLPGIYAIALGFLMARLGVVLPNEVLRPIQLLGDAAIPVNTVILGIQLSQTHLSKGLGLAIVTSGFRLLLAPAFGALLLRSLGFAGLPFKVLLLQTGMPSAVYSVILSSRFGANASLASSSVLLSTLLSAATLSVLLTLVAG